MSFVERLVCSKCGTKYEPSENQVMCRNRDLGRLDIIYDYDAVSDRLGRRALRERKSRDIWRYGELLPVSSDFAVRLGEGGTPLIHSRRLGERLGMKQPLPEGRHQEPHRILQGQGHGRGLGEGR